MGLIDEFIGGIDFANTPFSDPDTTSLPWNPTVDALHLALFGFLPFSGCEDTQTSQTQQMQSPAITHAHGDDSNQPLSDTILLGGYNRTPISCRIA